MMSYREGFESLREIFNSMTNDPEFRPSKPRISRVAGMDWWLCKNNVTHGYGHTPAEAHWQWFAWLKLGIYDGRTKT